MIIVEQPSKAFSPTEVSFRREKSSLGSHELVCQPLMISFLIAAVPCPSKP